MPKAAAILLAWVSETFPNSSKLENNSVLANIKSFCDSKTLKFALTISSGISVNLSLFSIVLVSSLLGTLTPIVLNKLKFNPALASGPFITTTNDLMALAIYFIVAIAMGGI